MIELLYLNLNNNIEFDFEKNKRIQLLANNNNGKSSLYFLLKFILGGKSTLIEKGTFFEKCNNRGIGLFFKWKIKLRGEILNVVYDTNNENNININGNMFKTKEYEKMLNIKIDVLGEKRSVYNVLLKESVANQDIKNSTYMDSNKNQSHTSIFLLKLAYGGKVNFLESYFANQGKLVNIEKIRRNTKKELDDYTKAEIKKEYKDSVVDYMINQDDTYYSDFSEYTKLRKIKNKKYNDDIVKEIKSLEIVNDIDKVIEFHDKIIDDYNSIIEERMAELEKNLFSNKIQETEYFINNINMTVSAMTEKAYEDLLEENAKLDVVLSSEENIFFKTIQDNYRKKIKTINKKDNLFHNTIKENRKNEKSASSLKIDISPVNNQGDGYIQVNYLYNVLYFLSESPFNFFMFDTKIYNEVDNNELNEFINSIKSNFPRLSFIMLNHINREVDNIYTIKLGNEEKIFGISI